MGARQSAGGNESTYTAGEGGMTRTQNYDPSSKTMAGGYNAFEVMQTGRARWGRESHNACGLGVRIPTDLTISKGAALSPLRRSWSWSETIYGGAHLRNEQEPDVK